MILVKSYSLEYNSYKKSKISNDFCTTSKKASLPFFFKYSSGSLASSNCKTLILKPWDFSINEALSVADFPALSISKHSKILDEYLLINWACSTVKAVPKGAILVSKSKIFADNTSMYPSIKME